MGRPQSVSITQGDIILSEVRAFKNGGGYIPVPKEYEGKAVKVVFLPEK